MKRFLNDEWRMVNVSWYLKPYILYNEKIVYSISAIIIMQHAYIVCITV